MLLKELNIRGFKSFLNTTKLTFYDGVTAIVGPNGSGKSNITDAIRWVLGESSVKTLRGSKMEDVIFTGTEEFKPVGFAEVNIVFSECDLERFPYSEISVTRRLYRDGESEYYINKNKVRLKDVRELFMDTGAGRDGYSIIGQGQIEQVLSTKPEDRRFIFEEASGISKFRYKKEESLNKLEKSKADLERLNDIYIEIEKNYKRTENDCIKADKYRNLITNKNTLELDLIKINLSKSSENKKSLNRNLEIYISNKVDYEYDLAHKKVKLAELEKDIEEKSNVQSDLSNKKMEVIRSFSEFKTDWKVSEETIRNLENEKASFTERIGSLNEKRARIFKSKTDLEIFLTQTSDVTLTDAEKQKKVEIQKKLDEMNAELSRLSEIAIENNLSYSKDKFDAESKTQKLEFFSSRLSELNNSKAEMENLIKKENANIADLLYKKEALQKEFAFLESNINKLKSEYTTLNENRKNYERAYAETLNLKNNLAYERDVKNNILNQFRLSGFANKKINEEFKKTDGNFGEVAYNIEVDKKYTKAIETALGAKLNYIITDTQANAKRMVAFLKSNRYGRATFLPLELYQKDSYYPRVVADDNLIGYAFDFVKIAPEFKCLIKSLMGPILIFKDLDSATENRKKYKSSIVTLDGDFLHFQGSITGGYNKKDNITPLSIKNEVYAINEQLTATEKELAKLKESETDFSNLNALEEKIQTTNEEYQTKKSDYLKLDADINIKNTTKENLETRLVEIVNSIKEVEANIRDIDLSEVSDEDYINSKLEYENYKVKYSAYKDSVEQILADLVKKEEDTKFVEFKLDNAKKKVAENNLEIMQIESEIANITEKIESCEEKLKEMKESRKSTFEKLSEFESAEAKIDSEINAIIDEKNMLNAKKIDLNANIISLQDDLTNMDEKINSLNIKLARIDENIQIELENLKKNYNFDIEDLTFVMPKKSITSITDELKRLDIEIESLGTVNLAAETEFRETKARKELFEKQLADCNKTISDLEKIISNLNSDMKNQFKKAFKEISENFKYVFETLFEGGEAGLSLVDETDPLNSGINIVAKPPGKKEQPLSLLSGGEKTLTAMALLFAFLKLKPSPFCILDEIDAALDDANIVRYTAFLKKLSKESQFIIITHRKQTIEVADTIYGVCMRKKGVSEIISMRFSDYVEES